MQYKRILIYLCPMETQNIHLNITKGDACHIHIGLTNSERALCGEVDGPYSHRKFKHTDLPVTCKACLAKLDSEALTSGILFSQYEQGLYELNQYRAKYGRR